MKKSNLRHRIQEKFEMAREWALRSREPRKQRRDSRPGSKRVYLLKNGLLSLNKTAPYLVSVTQSNSLSPLLRLPAELRTKIWKYALGRMRILCSNFIGVYSQPEASEDDEHAKFLPQEQLALLQVCRQIYDETATLTFSTNLFCFTSYMALEKVWKQMRPAQRDAVTRMVVERALMLHYLRPTARLKPMFTNPCAPFPFLKTIVVEKRSLRENQARVKQLLELLEEVRIAQGVNVVIDQDTKVVLSRLLLASQKRE